ncbi:MAG: HD domain-containing protein [Proteobacteria bacterium]|nr:HD domain-containing protein [Pseudomonadota bacterium]
MRISENLSRIARRIDREGGRPILVGGAVRDHLLGMESKDMDIEVFGLSIKRLLPVLEEFGKVSVVGKAFGVLKLTVDGEDFDFSLPRKDSKTGIGHKGFRIDTPADIRFEEAASRRDFTINAMGMDLLSGEILDLFEGAEDLKNRTLRVVDPVTFVHDPLRVLRGVQFSARFDLLVPPETRAVFRSLLPTVEELPKERIFEEVKKLLLKSERPSVGIKVADRIGLVAELFPELDALHGIRQDPVWHPEGDAWAHTLLVLDEAAGLRNGDEFHDLCLMLAALCHDFGKPETTLFSKGKWVSYGHAEAGEKPARRFLERMTKEIVLKDMVLSLVREHMKPLLLFGAEKVGNGPIRRLSLKIDIPLLVDLARADHLGRGDKGANGPEFPAGDWLMERWKALRLEDDRSIQPILMGRHLMELGLSPGPHFGKILKEAFELQLDDEIGSLDEALAWAKKRVLPDA